MTFDYRRARDSVFGVVRDVDGAIVGYERGPATIQEVALLLALIEFAPIVEPSTAALARMLKTTPRQVRRLLRSAEKKKLLRTEQRAGRRSRYILLLGDGSALTPDGQSSLPRADSPPTPDATSSPPRTNRPPKQTSKADKKAEGRSRSSRTPPQDFVPNDEDRKVEAEAVAAGVDVEASRRRWQNHRYPRAYDDFHGAWRNWLLNDVERARETRLAEPPRVPPAADVRPNVARAHEARSRDYQDSIPSLADVIAVAAGR